MRETRDVSLIAESGGFPGVGNGNPLQNSCLENPVDRGTWKARVHGIAESDTTERKHTQTQTHTHACTKVFIDKLETYLFLPL